MKYTHFISIFEGFFAIILSLQNISPVQTDRVNVTRQSDGDILVFKDKVACASFNAKCSGVPNNERGTTKYNTCDSCKCLSGYSTYLSTKNECINANEMTTLNCRIFRQKQITVLRKSTVAISRPIQAYRCQIKERYPEFYADNKETDTWIRMMDINFSLERRNLKRPNRRFRNWLVTFKNRTIFKMLSKYAGRIVKLELSCTGMRRTKIKKQTDLCIIFKIAGSIFGTVTGRNSTFVRYPHPTSVDPTIVLNTVKKYSTESPSSIKTSLPRGNNTAQDQKSKSEKFQVVWIIITVLLVIIIVLTGVIFFTCFKRRKTKRSNEEYRRRDITLHDYDVPTKSQDVHGSNPQGGDHVYATVLEMQNANSPIYTCPNEYQELNSSDREKDGASHYQPLVQPNFSELQYVDVLPNQAGAAMPLTNDTNT